MSTIESRAEVELGIHSYSHRLREGRRLDTEDFRPADSSAKVFHKMVVRTSFESVSNCIPVTRTLNS